MAKLIKKDPKNIKQSVHNFSVLFFYKRCVNFYRYFWNCTDLWIHQIIFPIHDMNDGIEKFCGDFPHFDCLFVSNDSVSDLFKAEMTLKLGFIAINIGRLKPHHWKYLILQKRLLEQLINLALYEYEVEEKD